MEQSRESQRRRARGHLAARGQAGTGLDPGRSPPARGGLLRAHAGSGRPDPARELRHQRTPRLVAARLVHRNAHRGGDAGDLRVPPRPGHRRSALHGQGHARAVASGAAHGARGAGGERRRDRHPARGRRHADAGDLAGDPRLQPRPHAITWRTGSSSRRRTIRRKTAASSTTRPTAARPTPTSPRGCRRRANELLRAGLDGVKRIPFETALAAADHAPGGLRPALRAGPRSTSSTWRRSAAPA